MLPGVGEELFDPAKAAAQNAGSSGEEFCRSLDPKEFCTKCLVPQWFDEQVIIFTEDPNCLQCFGICLDYYKMLDEEDIISPQQPTPTYLSCFACI